jgi:AbrB family looped-hinge helix DNA binding protein
MSAVKVTSKGRITIPASIRASIGIVAGTCIEFVEIENGKFIIVPTLVSIRSLKGRLRKPPTPVSIEKMNLAIANQGQRLK